jgi:hypothetical protein
MTAAGRHRRAVASTLEQADEAAATGDYHGALSWLGLLEAIGDELPQDYRTKRRAWHTAVAPVGHDSELVFPAGSPQDARRPARELT